MSGYTAPEWQYPVAGSSNGDGTYNNPAAGMYNQPVPAGWTQQSDGWWVGPGGVPFPTPPQAGPAQTPFLPTQAPGGSGAMSSTGGPTALPGYSTSPGAGRVALWDPQGNIIGYVPDNGNGIGYVFQGPTQGAPILVPAGYSTDPQGGIHPPAPGTYRTGPPPGAGSIGGSGGGGTLIDPTTGRPAYTGPGGEPGYGTPQPGATQWTMPDGRTAWYFPGTTPSAGNLQALKSYSGGSSTGAGGTNTGAINENDVYQSLLGLNPWIGQLGLQSQILTWAQQGLSPDSIVAEIRATPQWQSMFPGIRRPDGTLRMNEGQYQGQEDSYRQLLNTGGFQGDQWSHQDLAAFFQNEIDPNELQTRIDKWNQVQTSGGSTKAAFAVYAGIPLTDEQIFQAMIDPSVRQDLVNQYTTAVTTTPLDYQTFIQRATQYALESTVSNPANAGALNLVQNLDPNHVQYLTDQLFTAGSNGGHPMSLDALTNAVQAALVGGAATDNGLALPTQERANEFVAAGIDRAKALSTYGQIAQSYNQYQGNEARAGRTPLNQSGFENALFLNRAPEQSIFQQGEAYESSLGEHSGNPDFQQGYGRTAQPGLGGPYASVGPGSNFTAGPGF